MRYIIIALLLFGSYCKVLCQELITDDSIILKPGIYMSFQEFRNNSPSINEGYTIEEDSVKANKGIYLAYHLNINVDLKKRDVWGFCDGKYVYKRGWKGLTGQDIYDKIPFIGRYCILDHFVPAHVSSSSAALMSGGIPLPIVGVKTSALYHLIMNFNNGQVFGPSKDVMEMILGDDPELHAKYMALGKKSRQRQWSYFIIDFAIRHKDEIKLTIE